MDGNVLLEIHRKLKKRNKSLQHAACETNFNTENKITPSLKWPLWCCLNLHGELSFHHSALHLHFQTIQDMLICKFSDYYAFAFLSMNKCTLYYAVHDKTLKGSV